MVDQSLNTNRGVDGAARGIVVLLVDDQAFVAVVVGRLLASEQDIALHCCHNALEAIALANQLNPTIILQDLVMPGIDGLTLVRLFRANPATSSTPVIVLSGNDDADARARSLAEGATDYLVKLPAKEALIACIRRHAIADASREETGTRASGGAPATSQAETKETLDRSVLAALGGSDAADSSDFMRTLIDQYVREASSQVDLLKDTARQSDWQTLEATAHSLKGSSMTIGATRLAALCGRLEGGACRQPGVAAEVLVEIDSEFSRLRDALAGERRRLEPDF